MWRPPRFHRAVVLLGVWQVHAAVQVAGAGAEAHELERDAGSTLSSPDLNRVEPEGPKPLHGAFSKLTILALCGIFAQCDLSPLKFFMLHLPSGNLALRSRSIRAMENIGGKRCFQRKVVWHGKVQISSRVIWRTCRLLDLS